MISLKSILVSSGCGFFLSFFIGLLSGNHFGSVLLKALLTAFVFAVLAEGIFILYKKFLSEDVSETDDSSAQKNDKTSGVIDISVEDEDLNDDEQSPQFFVDSTKKNFAVDNPPEAEISDEVSRIPEQKEEPASEMSDSSAAKETSKSSFVPLDPGKMEHVSSSDVHAAGVNVQSADEELDVLPDMTDFSPGRKSDDVGDIISDSDFASEGNSLSGGSSYSGGNSSSEQNTDAMAKAIRTLLSKDN